MLQLTTVMNVHSTRGSRVYIGTYIHDCKYTCYSKTTWTI